MRFSRPSECARAGSCPPGSFARMCRRTHGARRPDCGARSSSVVATSVSRGSGWTTILVEMVEIAHPERDRPDNRFNDGKAGPDGRYWAGTMHEAEELATGSLYAFGPDGAPEVLDSGYRVANGPAFSLDGSIRLPHRFGSAGDLLPSTSPPTEPSRTSGCSRGSREGEGHPDGMTTDRQGNLWVAMWDGGRVEQLSPEGARLGAVPIPTPRPTSCTFVDSECTEMFVTSASVGASSEDPLAGGLFRVCLG